MSAHPAGSLGRVLEDLGSTLLDLVHGDALTAGEIGGVGIHDPYDEQHYPAHAIVLGVGVHGAEDIAGLLRSLRAQKATALVVRAPVEDADALGPVVAETGVALLALTRGASWAQLAAMLRTLLSEEDIGDAEAHTLGGVPSGDLFALANAIATLLDAPVTIEDRRSRVLAFSGRQDEADSSRVETILARQVPERYLRIHEEDGVFRELYRSHGLVHVPAATAHDEDALPRVAVAVRAGDEFLGSVWAAVRRPLTPEREQAFLESAKLVALHMLRFRAGTDAENRLRAGLVTTVLEGGAEAVEALGRLGLVDEPTLVMAMGLVPDHDEDHAHITAERQRLAGALAVHLTAVQPRSAVALLGDTIYALLPVPGDTAHARERAAHVASNFLQRTGEHTGAVIGIGSVAQEPAALPRSRTNADRALRVLLSGRSAQRVAAISDVYVDALMLEMRDLAIANRDELSGPLARLVAYDAKHNAHLVETLRAWLDAFGDVIAASASVFVHPNTFRYRLRRVAEVGRIDLQDPSARFAAMVQLRLMGVGETPSAD
ncbi:PucR family transcriptional regulator [Streptomyces sp. NBRC 14336]|uniref:PucR family transcriptional regulator n=1 Tax=Streptomyces sp. NBRC 14336 TaxID=3030992 RepID=UPI0024A029A5|nr:helix-turn-helix domain-containing protein [Streptomyces sp. NBRC 14336]WBO76511.1 helix-turn-helix domain-containing protein [Streptomyces sp. SBE_14.2]GLW49424.1 PucR family transcriptional regulator [Streptomyces sp. NBRC 14336]